MKKQWDLRRKLQYFYLRFKRLQGSPQSLALGTAIGAGLGVTPTLPFHTLLIIGATLMLRANTIAAIIAATLVSNPLTFALHYYAAWWLGDLVLPDRLTWEKLHQLLQLLKSEGLVQAFHTLSSLGWDTILVMTVGGCLLALPFGLVFYACSLRFFKQIHLKRMEKHRLH
jgi:uncharacterized protein